MKSVITLEEIKCNMHTIQYDSDNTVYSRNDINYNNNNYNTILIIVVTMITILRIVTMITILRIITMIMITESMIMK